jgi:arsenite methyltransferase
MTDEVLTKSRTTAELLGHSHIEFRRGLAEDLPVADGWADVGDLQRCHQPGTYLD